MSAKRIGIAVAAIIAVGAVAVAAILFFGGGRLSPEEAMAAAIEKVEGIETYAFTGEIDMESLGQNMTMDIDGVARTGDKPADNQFAMMAEMDLMGQSITMDERLIDGKLYIKYEPDPTGAEPKWYFMDLDLASLQGAGAGNVNPSDYLTYMKAYSSVEEIGTEDVNGVKCRHYALGIDMAKVTELALENVKAIQEDVSGEPPTDEELDQMRTIYENMQMTIDLYIGVDDGLPHREVVDITMSDPVEVGMKATIDLGGFNEPVEIEQPEGAVPLPGTPTAES